MRWLLAPLLALLPAPALADLTATYGRPGTSFVMKVEVAANGDVHGDMLDQPGVSIITRGGHGYFVQPSASGPVVMRVEDMAKVITEELTRVDPGIRARASDQSAPNFVEKGTATVNGRTGAAYFWQMRNGSLSRRPLIVISQDPALAPLAMAMAGQFDMSMAMMSQIMPTAWAKPMQQVLKTGAPLAFAGSELQSVSNEPIPRRISSCLPNRPRSMKSANKWPCQRPRRNNLGE